MNNIRKCTAQGDSQIPVYLYEGQISRGDVQSNNYCGQSVSDSFKNNTEISHWNKIIP